MSDEYTEHDKLRLISGHSQAIHDFLDESKYLLAEWVHLDHGEVIDKAGCADEPENCRLYHHDELWPHREGLAKILATYFEIDLNKIEQEKRAMINSLREMNSHD